MGGTPFDLLQAARARARVRVVEETRTYTATLVYVRNQRCKVMRDGGAFHFVPARCVEVLGE
jgi:hypothetical protein